MKQIVRAGSVLFLSFLWSLTACNKTELRVESVIEQAGLPGTWEVTQIEINGVSDMTPICCQWIVISEDGIPEDRCGTFRYYDAFSDRSGIFELSSDTDSMTIYLDDDVFKRAYSVQSDELQLDYIEDGDAFFTTWKKIN